MKIGWIVAGIIVLVVGIAITVFVVFPPASGPTAATMATGMLDRQTVETPVERIAGFRPDEPGDAAEDLHRAAEIARANHDRLTGAMRNLSTPTGTLSVQERNLLDEVLGHVETGVRKERNTYCSRYGPERMQIRRSYLPADDLQMVGSALEIYAGYHFRRKDYEQAERVLRALFLLGWHMNRERARVTMVRHGLGLEDLALSGMFALYGDEANRRPDRLDAVRDYKSELGALRSWFSDKADILWTPQPEPGDVLNIVENDDDRCWRVEGILILGILRYSAPKRGDQRKVAALLERCAASEDPLESAAARAARELTEADFNRMGGQ